MNPLKPVNLVFDFYTGGKHRPVFFDIDAVQPKLRSLDAAVDRIRCELASILPGCEQLAPRYHEISDVNTPISAVQDPDRDWRVFLLTMAGNAVEANIRRCPETARLVADIPHVSQAFFSILDPGKNIPEHCGPYRGYLRYHLGLEVPAVDTPELVVNGEHYRWQTGASVMFDDSWPHEVINHCRERRVVLVVDILRPMPQPLHALNCLVTWLLGKTIARSIVKKLRQ